ncbi:hypothetical protein SAXI111661_10090 [Saccharomonospora xinjiangensis]|nr:hypothetical protein EYD13_07910 [Saccharomonospora xinjiangensis]
MFVLLATLISCGSAGGRESMDYDKEFSGQLRALRDGAQNKPLKDLVPGDWTSVHIILGPHTEEWVEREVGAPLPDSGYGFDAEGNIHVFMRGQKVVRMKGTTGRLLGEGHFSSAVVLARHGQHHRHRRPDTATGELTLASATSASPAMETIPVCAGPPHRARHMSLRFGPPTSADRPP